MAGVGNRWAILLAAGEGSRLRAITVDDEGRAIPKQYCSLRGERTLLGDALERASGAVDPGRIVTIVAAEHRALFEAELQDMSSRNLIVQPRNRGTAIGLLLPLLTILERDPAARVLVLPADHHVENEGALLEAIQRAFEIAEFEPSRVVLLGVVPDSADRDYGWILRDARERDRVTRFVEKPDVETANELFEHGALWNSFIFVAHGRTLLEMLAQKLPRHVAQLGALRATPVSERAAFLSRVYADLETADFSRDVLAGLEPRLSVLATPPCGWTDLGTPERVAQCLERESVASPRRVCTAPVVLSRALASVGSRTVRSARS